MKNKSQKESESLKKKLKDAQHQLSTLKESKNKLDTKVKTLHDSELTLESVSEVRLEELNLTRSKIRVAEEEIEALTKSLDGKSSTKPDVQMESILSMLNEKFESVEKNIKESILTVVSKNNKLFEDKMNKALESKIKNAIKETNKTVGDKESTSTNLGEIMKQQHG